MNVRAKTDCKIWFSAAIDIVDEHEDVYSQTGKITTDPSRIKTMTHPCFAFPALQPLMALA